MKIFPILFLIVLRLPAIVQPGVAGHYRDHFGSEIEFNPDSSFHYLWRFDLQASWTRGTYTVRHDTIYLTTIPVYDTVQVNHGNQLADSLVLSAEGHPKRVSLSERAAFCCVSQNSLPSPKLLYYRKGRLYEIDKQGKLIRKKRRGWGKKKFDPWYFRSI
jgi:hypothetical protein